MLWPAGKFSETSLLLVDQFLVSGSSFRERLMVLYAIMSVIEAVDSVGSLIGRFRRMPSELVRARKSLEKFRGGLCWGLSEFVARMKQADRSYIGRLAPTPTGFMHLGHARTFLAAQRRAEEAGGRLFMRIEDLDMARCKPEFVAALEEDLAWAGLRWEPEVFRQSERLEAFRAAWRKLRDGGFIFPCWCSRKDVAEAARAPHAEGGEAIYPGTCREREWEFASEAEALEVNWRFRVPDGERVGFVDRRLGEQAFVAGRDFGDFLVWRKDGIPSYELAVVADDVAQGVTEVVRGEDLLVSTARQLLIYRALGEVAPAFFHCPLVLDTDGRRLAKRDKAMGLRELRASGVDPARLEEMGRIE